MKQLLEFIELFLLLSLGALLGLIIYGQLIRPMLP